MFSGAPRVGGYRVRSESNLVRFGHASESEINYLVINICPQVTFSGFNINNLLLNDCAPSKAALCYPDSQRSFHHLPFVATKIWFNKKIPYQCGIREYVYWKNFRQLVLPSLIDHKVNHSTRKWIIYKSTLSFLFLVATSQDVRTPVS